MLFRDKQLKHSFEVVRMIMVVSRDKCISAFRTWHSPIVTLYEGDVVLWSNLAGLWCQKLSMVGV